jgi:regulator of protease activity HflC (stomatin/prohibitin superfamily)
MAGLIALIVVAVFVLFVAARTIRIIPQAKAGIIERLGRYNRTLEPGLTIVIPFVDRLKPLIDLREQVVTFAPQPVITEDNLVVGIDSVLYFTVTDAKAVTYEVANPLQAIEQLTITTLRNVIGGMTLEQTLTSRDSINAQLRVVLDEATGKWGIRINRVELKSVDPPPTIQEAMEKQMRAERDRRAAILTAEGVKQSQILTAEGEKQSAVLKAEGAKTSAILRSEGEAKAIDTVFNAIHAGRPDRELLSYQYLQMLPQLAQGSANKIFVIPSEFSQALGNLGQMVAGRGGGDDGAPPEPSEAVRRAGEEAAAESEAAARAAREAQAEAESAQTPGLGGPRHVPPELGGGEPPAPQPPVPPAA